jgi:ATP-dependent DNA ligase
MARPLGGRRRTEATALPSWIKPQLTKLVDQPPDGPDWLHEIKFDGYRMHARLDRGAVRLLTRTGLDSPHFRLCRVWFGHTNQLRAVGTK